jgi:hypothetical protein
VVCISQPINGLIGYIRAMKYKNLARTGFEQVTKPSRKPEFLVARHTSVPRVCALLITVNGDAADLVRQGKCGLTTESENPQALADAVDVMAAMPAFALKTIREKASSFYRKALGLQVGAVKFDAVFESLSRNVRGRRHEAAV